MAATFGGSERLVAMTWTFIKKNGILYWDKDLATSRTNKFIVFDPENFVRRIVRAHKALWLVKRGPARVRHRLASCHGLRAFSRRVVRPRCNRRQPLVMTQALLLTEDAKIHDLVNSLRQINDFECSTPSTNA
jgi:hypothetical protein